MVGYIEAVNSIIAYGNLLITASDNKEQIIKAVNDSIKDLYTACVKTGYVWCVNESFLQTRFEKLKDSADIISLRRYRP